MQLRVRKEQCRQLLLRLVSGKAMALSMLLDLLVFQCVSGLIEFACVDQIEKHWWSEIHVVVIIIESIISLLITYSLHYLII